MIVEGDRYTLLDRHGRPVEDWQVLAVYEGARTARRALLANAADPAHTMELHTAELSDRRRFRRCGPRAVRTPSRA